jgi:hypothetical protein
LGGERLSENKVGKPLPGANNPEKIKKVDANGKVYYDYPTPDQSPVANREKVLAPGLSKNDSNINDALQ